MIIVLHGTCAIAAFIVAASLGFIGCIATILGLIARRIAIVAIGCSLVALSVVAQSGWDAHCVAAVTGTFVWRWGAFARDFTLTWMHAVSIFVAFFVAAECFRRGAMRALSLTKSAIFVDPPPPHAA